MRVVFQGSQLGTVGDAVRAGWDRWGGCCFAALSRPADYMVNPEGIFCFFVGCSVGVSKDYLFLLFLLPQIAALLEFGQSDHLLFVDEVWHRPFSLFLIPVRVIDDSVQLFGVHQNGQDGLEFLNFFFLETDRIE